MVWWHRGGPSFPGTPVFPSSRSSSRSKRSAMPARRPSPSTAVTDKPRPKARKRERWPWVGGTCAQWGGGGDTDTSPTPQSPPVSPCSYLPRSNIYHVVTAGGLGQSLQQLQGEESFGGCSRRGGSQRGAGSGGAPTFPRRRISCCFLGLTWRRSRGCRRALWQGGRWDPPGRPRGKARARVAAAKARRERGQAAPGPPGPPRSPASCGGAAVARAACQGGGSCAHSPSVKKSCGDAGVSGGGDV